MTTSDRAGVKDAVGDAAKDAVPDVVTDAVRRGDVGRLSAYFDGTPCPVAVLRRLIGHADPVLRHLGVVLLRDRAGWPDPGSVAEAAPLLSAASAALSSAMSAGSASLAGSAETAVVLAEACARLRVPVPQRRSSAWPAKVRIAWLRAEIIARPEATVRAEPPGEELYQAVRAIDADAPADLDGYLRGLVARPDPVLRAAALGVVREAVYGALLGPEQARGWLVELLDPAGGARVVAGALAELAEPWAAGDAPASVEPALRRLVSAHPEAVETAARFGLSGLLREIAADPRLPGHRRRRALESVGEFAERGQTAGLSALAGTDPLLFAEPFLACLRAMHRRGHFVRADDVPAVIEIALADYRVSTADVAIVLFTVRHEALRALTAVADDDPHEARRVELLHALAAQGAPDLPVGEVLTGRLAGSVRPEPILSVLRELRYQEAEDAVLATLPRAPRAALRALEAIGGARTVEALREALGVTDPDGVVAPYLRPVAGLALEVLWHLTDDPAARRTLRARLNRRGLPERVAADLGIPDPDELAVRTSDLDVLRPGVALCRLAEHGDARTIPVLADLLLRVVSDLVANRGEEAAEPVVPGKVYQAIGDLGERLYRRRVLRPVCLLDASAPEAARKALVVDLTLGLLERSGVTDAELAVLLELLGRVPSAHVKDRVHHLIRHRDPHVRKHVIALLAHDADLDAARSLSASLIPLTSAADPQTVRQALLALGHARARWAGEAIAACLDHPVMNIKKTAAQALIDAGTPAQVPALLRWLGRHDNPGLRESLTRALRVILGRKAYPVCVLSAAERATDARERGLLLDALAWELSVPAVAALVRRGSPVAEPLLTRLARGTTWLKCGRLRYLAAEFAAYDIALPEPTAGEDAEMRADLITLARKGGRPDHEDTRAVLRLAARSGDIGVGQRADLREALPQMLAVARDRPADRATVLRLALDVCPAPWSAAELGAFADAYDVLAAELGAVGGVEEVLEGIADTLSEVAAFALAARVRALPARSFAGRAPLAVLRCCGAVLTRHDVDRALTGARLGPNPWEAEVEVLRLAFMPTAGADAAGADAARAEPDRRAGESDSAVGCAAPRDRHVAAVDTDASAHVAAWRTALDDAVRSLPAFTDFRARAGADAEGGGAAGCADIDSRARVDALIDAFPTADPACRGPLLDWLTELQPIGAPAWVLAERAARPARAAAPRVPDPTDLDQPRSTAQRERLLALLNAAEPARRTAAARTLSGWDEPEVRRATLDAYLRGTPDLPPQRGLARALLGVTDFTDYDEGGRERAARLCALMSVEESERMTPHLVSWWENGAPATRAQVFTATRRIPADTLAEVLRTRLEAGRWGCLDLLASRSTRRTPELTETVRRLRVQGRADLADRLNLTDGFLLGVDAAARSGRALAELRTRSVPAGAERPTRDELIGTARGDGPEQARRALSRLADEHGGDDEVRALVVELLSHPVPRVRLHAHRVSRRLLDRAAYLRHTEGLLADPRRDIVRMAIRTLSHAGWEPAVPGLVTLFGDADPVVREAAAEALARIGVPALPALRKAAAHARPDRRARYTELRDRIEAAPR
ncbi:HEAT repeat domain-containing protein [Embleya sp. NPDC050154]|uniref:HEAT repeat domain-containing protein n=1 Tax=Embleya sp. NPDC050154 TaxID=3363988 RepID=UPI00379DC44C